MNDRILRHPEREIASEQAASTCEEQRPAPLPSEALLRGRRLVEIAHNGEVYRLQATRLGKLILTK
jgi:hemin uptake protein HemP